jgi:quercetin dioxygenase-like cupin family protein
MKLASVVVGICLMGAFAWAQQGHVMMTPDQVKWGDAPAVLPKGAKMAVLYGDPSKPGMFVVRLKMPANYRIPPHWHPTDELLTVISGNFSVGMGDKLDTSAQAMAPGSFISLPAKMHHFAFAREDAVVEMASTGPFAIHYLNPADDPSRGAASTAPGR